MSGETSKDRPVVRKLVIDPKLFVLTGGTKRDRERLQERVDKAEEDGLVTVVDLSTSAPTARKSTQRR